MAGVGKSAIALTTAQCLKNGRTISAKSDSETTRDKPPRVTLVAEYFVSFREATTSSIESLFPTIAMQLANASPVAQVVIDDALKQTPTIADEFNDDQARALFIEPLCAVAAEHNLHKLVMVIDGVDEFVDKFARANQDVLYTVTSTLCDAMAKLPPNVRVLILSRPERGIAPVLNTSLVSVKQLHLPTAESRDDVRRFLSSNLEDYADHQLRQWKDWPDEQRFNDLCYLADGHFTCASVALRWIVSELNDADNLEVRRNEVFDDLRQAELTGLDELYGFVLAREILDRFGKPIQFRLNVIGYLLALREPIPNIGILSILIDTEPNRVLDVIQRIRSLLFEETEQITEQTVLRPHKSFVDFVVGNRDNRFPVNVAEGHHQLAEGCLRILLDPDKLHFNMTCIKGLVEESADLDVEPVIVADVNYACLAFLDHVLNAPTRTAFIPRLLRFLENQFLFWLEALDRNQVSKVAVRLRSLQNEMSSVQTDHPQHAQLTHIIDDVLKFFDCFGPDISSFTKHASIYFSAIPFAPASSPIANHYRARYPSALSSIIPDPNDNWDGIPSESSMRILVRSVATDGKHIFVNMGNRTVQCCDAKSGIELFSTSIKPDSNDADDCSNLECAFSPDGKFVAVGYHACRVWNVESGEEEEGIMMKVPSDDSVWSLSFSPDGNHIIAGCESGNIRVWSRTSGEIPISPFRGHTGPVNSVAYSPHGTHIVSASSLRDASARVWDISTGACIFTPPGYWRIAVFSPDGTQIATALEDTIQVWNALNPSSKSPHHSTFKAPSEAGIIFSLTYSSEGQFLVSGNEECILVWDILTGQNIATLTGHSGWVRGLTFFPDGKRLISLSQGNFDSTVHVWDVESLFNGQRSEADNSQWNRWHGWILNADRQWLFRPPRYASGSMSFRHPRNTITSAICLSTPSFSPIAYDEEWKRLGESLMHHARTNLLDPHALLQTSYQETFSV